MKKDKKCSKLKNAIMAILSFFVNGEWLMCDRAKIAFGSHMLKKYTPKFEPPADKSKWDIGHKCLEYFDKVLPARSVMSSSHYNFLAKKYTWLGLRLSPLESVALSAIIPLGKACCNNFRDTVGAGNATVESLKAARFANCHEWSVVAHRWLRAQGVNAYIACGGFSTDKEKDKINSGEKHVFVLYTLPGTPPLSFDDMMANLNNPNVRIVDLWVQKCGTVHEVMQHWAQQFVVGQGKECAPVTPGLKFVINKQESCPDKFVVGTVSARNATDTKNVFVALQENSPVLPNKKEATQKQSHPAQVEQRDVERLEIINAEEARAYDDLLQAQISFNQKRKQILSGIVIASAVVLLGAINTENDWVKTIAFSGLVGGGLGVATLHTLAPEPVKERQKLAGLFRGNRMVFSNQRQ